MTKQKNPTRPRSRWSAATTNYLSLRYPGQIEVDYNYKSCNGKWKRTSERMSELDFIEEFAHEEAGFHHGARVYRAERGGNASDASRIEALGSNLKHIHAYERNLRHHREHRGVLFA